MPGHRVAGTPNKAMETDAKRTARLIAEALDCKVRFPSEDQMAPNVRNRTPAEIVMENVTFDSAGYVYRGLSWVDYAKRQTSVSALQYAALDVRQAIEQLFFEELVMSVGGKLAREEYETCKGNSTKLKGKGTGLLLAHNSLIR